MNAVYSKSDQKDVASVAALLCGLDLIDERTRAVGCKPTASRSPLKSREHGALELAQTSRQPTASRPSLNTINVSSGTAGALGLASVTQSALPTTAYLLIGGRCQRTCAFCAQARTSRARKDALSRITWPAQDLETTIAHLKIACQQGTFHRCCLQVTDSPGHLEQAEYVLSWIHQVCTLPLSVSIVAHRLDDIQRLFRAGAERVALALDAATPQIHHQVKGPGWERTLALLETAAECFPGRISTHLIAGLGETERDLAVLFQRLADQGITVGLFAFTPIPGTSLERQAPPPLAAYRRLQVACYLIASGRLRVGDIAFASDGHILGYGLAPAELAELLSDGQAFRTSGCPGCNRPYYNERPGGAMYNYPRPLTPKETAEAVALALVVGCKPATSD